MPTWPVLGAPAASVTLVRGRLPQPGEALVSTTVLRTLGMAEPVGFLLSVDGLQQYPVVGSFVPRTPFDDLAAGAIVAATTGTAGRELRVVIDDIASATPTVSAILSTLGPVDAKSVQVDSPTALAQTARDLNAQVSGYGRQLLLLILAAGGTAGAAVNVVTGYPTPVSFTLAVGVLAVLVAVIAALPAALYASRLDPVQVLRTP